jgi:hypothetical protein
MDKGGSNLQGVNVKQGQLLDERPALQPRECKTRGTPKNGFQLAKNILWANHGLDVGRYAFFDA